MTTVTTGPPARPQSPTVGATVVGHGSAPGGTGDADAVAADLAAHAGSHTTVHGIPDTSLLETKAGAQAKANAAAADVQDGLATVATSGAYGDLSGRPAIPSIAGLATSLSVAQADAIIQAGVDAVAAALAAHAGAVDPHGDRAYTDARIAALIGGAPGLADTLGEIAAILAADEAGVAALTTAVNARLVAANNLADLTSPAAARTALQLATVAATGAYADLSGRPTIPVTIADLTETGTAKIMTAAERAAIAALGNAATRNVGTTAGTVAAGDDSRMTNARTPTAHKASHAVGGSDALSLADIGAGTAATKDTGTASGQVPLLGAGGVLAIGRLATGTPDGTKFVRDDGTLAAAPTALLPRQALITGFHYPTAFSTTPAQTVQASAGFGATVSAGVAVNNYLEWEFLADAGTYTLWLTWTKNTNNGIVTISVDTADQATTVDLYGTFVAMNATLVTSTLALTAGRHVVRCRVLTKNASSSNYAQLISGLVFSRTGA